MITFLLMTMLLPLVLLFMWWSVWAGLWVGWAALWSAWFALPALMFGVMAFGWLMLFGLPHPHLFHLHFHPLPTLLLATLAVAVGIWLARRYPRAIDPWSDGR